MNGIAELKVQFSDFLSWSSGGNESDGSGGGEMLLTVFPHRFTEWRIGRNNGMFCFLYVFGIMDRLDTLCKDLRSERTIENATANIICVMWNLKKSGEMEKNNRECQMPITRYDKS